MVTIGFSTTDKWMSRLIRFFTKSPISHVWISYYDETLNTKMVMQAEWFGYELRPWARWSRENKLVAEYKLNITEQELRTALQVHATSIGVKYDYLSAGLSGLGPKINWKIHQGLGRFMCGESVLRFLQLCPSYRTWFSRVDVETTPPLPIMMLCGILSQTSQLMERVS